MKRQGGPTSRFAYDPATLVAYLDAQTDYVTQGEPTRTRRVIGLVPVDPDTDARVIRRWRSGVIEGVTKAAAARLLEKFGLTTDTYEWWAYANGRAAVKWGQLTLPISN